MLSECRVASASRRKMTLVQPFMPTGVYVSPPNVSFLPEMALITVGVATPYNKESGRRGEREVSARR